MLLIVGLVMLAVVGFWLTVLVNLFVNIEFAVSLLVLYLPVGLALGLFSLVNYIPKIIIMSRRRSKRKFRLKTAFKKNMANSLLNLIKDILLWSCFGLYFLTFWFLNH